MPRIKMSLPSEFAFSTLIPIRITDINYGGHVGNDTVLSIIHEARMQYLRSHGFTEMQFGGVGMIMRDAAIEFKSELFYGDLIIASVAFGEVTKASFELFYKLEKKLNERTILVALATTGMVCYDYEKKKIAPFPENIRQTLQH